MTQNARVASYRGRALRQRRDQRVMFGRVGGCARDGRFASGEASGGGRVRRCKGSVRRRDGSFRRGKGDMRRRDGRVRKVRGHGGRARNIRGRSRCRQIKRGRSRRGRNRQRQNRRSRCSGQQRQRRDSGQYEEVTRQRADRILDPIRCLHARVPHRPGETNRPAILAVGASSFLPCIPLLQPLQSVTPAPLAHLLKGDGLFSIAERHPCHRIDRAAGARID